MNVLTGRAWGNLEGVVMHTLTLLEIHMTVRRQTALLRSLRHRTQQPRTKLKKVDGRCKTKETKKERDAQEIEYRGP